MEKGELQTARKIKQNQGPNQSTPVVAGPAHNSRLLVSKAFLPVPPGHAVPPLKQDIRPVPTCQAVVSSSPLVWVIPCLLAQPSVPAGAAEL